MPAQQFGIRVSFFYAFLFLGMGVQLPFLPLWLKDKGLTAPQIALVLAAQMASRVVSSPLGAFAADRLVSRRALIIGCSLASFAAYVALAFANDFVPILLLAVLASGLFAPAPPLTENFAVEGSAIHNLDYGRLRLWGSLSFFTGTLVAGAFLEVIPVSWVVVMIAAAQGVLAVVAVSLPADPAQKMRREADNAGSPSLLGIQNMRLLFFFLLAASIGQASHGVLYGFGSVHWDGLGYSKSLIGLLWGIGVVVEVTLFAFSNAVLARYGAVLMILIGVAGACLRWTALGGDPALLLLLPLQALHACSFGLTHLGTMHFIRENVPGRLTNTVQGLYSAVYSAAIALTMWASGPLYRDFAGGAYYVMAVMAAVALVFALLLYRLSPRVPERAET